MTVRLFPLPVQPRRGSPGDGTKEVPRAGPAEPPPQPLLGRIARDIEVALDGLPFCRAATRHWPEPSRRATPTGMPRGKRPPSPEVMTRSPRSLNSGALVRDAVRLVREFRSDEIPVVDEAGRPVGLLDVQDLIALKVVS